MVLTHRNYHLKQLEAARRVIVDAEASIRLLDAGIVVTGEEHKMAFSRIRSSTNTIVRVLTYRANVNSVPPLAVPQHRPQAPVPEVRRLPRQGYQVSTSRVPLKQPQVNT